MKNSEKSNTEERDKKKIYRKEEKEKILLFACWWTEAIAHYESYGKT